MVKHVTAILLILTLCLAGITAVYAENVAVSGEGLSVYIGPGDKLFSPGKNTALIDDMVSDIYAADSTYVIYATSTELVADTDREGALYVLDLSGEEPVSEEIDEDVITCAWDSAKKVMYFVCAAEPTQLKSFDPLLHETRDLAGTDEIYNLRMSVDGVLAFTGSEEKLYVPIARMFVEPLYAPGENDLEVGDGFETLLDGDGNLAVRMAQAEEVLPVAANVLCSCVDGSIIYFIEQINGVYTLKSCTVGQDVMCTQCEYPEPMMAQLTVGQGHVFAVSESYNVYDFQLAAGYLTQIATIDSDVAFPVILGGSKGMVVYDQTREMGERFIEVIPAAQYVQDEADEEDVEEEEDEEESEPTPAPKPTVVPAPQPEYEVLSKGMRGEAVTKLQQALRKYGYLTLSADGIFGSSTQAALMYLQGDMGLSETGKADVSLQKKLYSGKNIPTYEKYVSLSKGDEGLRVQDLQERLRTLCYMTVNAGGHYKDGTTAAVKRFQKQMGYKQTGNITASQMKALYKSSCPECTEYYKLEKGDSSPAVKRLNKRLKKLGYFSGTAGESYSKATVKAVELFQSYNGLKVVAGCDGDLQSMIFSKNAKEYHSDEPDPTPKPAPDTYKKPSNKQLKVMRNWLNKHYGTNMDNHQAVTMIQERLVQMGYLDSGYTSGKYDKKTWSAVQKFQLHDVVSKFSDATGIADKTTLSCLFSGV